MPEGDTVWRAAHQLHDALAGGVLTVTDFRVPQLATVDLTGRRVLGVAPRGKHLLARVEGGVTVHSHLGMEGAWRIGVAGERPRGGPAHQIRVILATASRTATGYRLPLLELLRTPEEETALGHLGPDLLGADWDPVEAERRLLADPGRPLAEALLDQRNLAGIGNVYAAELCFLAGTSPWTPVGELPESLPARLLKTAHRLLDANKNRLARRTTLPRGSAQTPASGGVDRDRALWVYGRAHRPCHRCGTAIRSGLGAPPMRSYGGGSAERARTAYYCPRCQPGPRPNAEPAQQG